MHCSLLLCIHCCLFFVDSLLSMFIIVDSLCIHSWTVEFLMIFILHLVL